MSGRDEPATVLLPCLIGQAFRRVALRCLGARGNPALVCVHGLTRNARDFDGLARALADRMFVVSVDLPGRGESEWLEDPAQYGVETYVAVLAQVFAWVGRPVDFLGTSLGGICAMAVAAMPGQPIARLVLNDIGPFVPEAAMRRIAEYVTTTPPRFADVEALRLYLRRVHAPFGRLSEAEWRQMAMDSARPLPDGSVALHFDPAIATPFAKTPPAALVMWPWWEALSVPVLALRGANSDVLEVETAARMTGKATVVSVPETGHAPALLDAPTIGAVRRFLLGHGGA